jgi:ribonuclease HII
VKSGKRNGRRWDQVERELRAAVGPMIAGVDEVGRGPLAGPVVACAVIMPPNVRAIAGVDDSKQLTGLQRLRLARLIRRRAIAVALGAASAREIDRWNIYHATTLAIRRALGRLGAAPDHVLVDGRAIRTLGVPHTAIVGGDARCYSIACASIIAKVTRDRVMKALAKRYPTYGWERNVGYSTAKHLAGLALSGATAHHRRSFVPVFQLALDLADGLTPNSSTPLVSVPRLVIDPATSRDLAADRVAAARG